MLGVCTSATSTDGGLATTAQLRTMLGTTSTADDPAQLAAILAATRWAENYIGVPAGHLLTQVYSENLPAFGGQTLMLSRRPVLAVSRILLNSTSTADATVYSSTDFRIDREGGFLWTDKGFAWTAQMPYQLGPSIYPNSELQPWYVEYAAGYIPVSGTTATCGTNSTSTGYTVPDDITQAVILKARELFENVAGVVSQKIGDLSLTYRSEGYTDAAKCLLEPYRRTTV